jgi:LacI family transcriptional regulator
MREHGVDGLIICPAEGTGKEFVDDAAGWEMPLVQALRIVPGTVSDYAGTDYRGGMQEATEYLISLGHRRIGFISGNRRHSAQADRLEGFLAAMKAGGLAPLFVSELELTHAAARAAATEIMSRPNAPTALICFNDVIGLGLHRGLSDLGVVLGDALSLIGFDDVAEADLVRPGLASVATEPFKVGENAAKLLLRRIGEPESEIRREIVPTRLVPRGSAGRVHLGLT